MRYMKLCKNQQSPCALLMRMVSTEEQCQLCQTAQVILPRQAAKKIFIHNDGTIFPCNSVRQEQLL